MKRAILTFLGIALIGYVGSYVAVRMYSVEASFGVLLGIGEEEAITAYGEPDSEKSISLVERNAFLLRVYLPMIWLDEHITGADLNPIKPVTNGR